MTVKRSGPWFNDDGCDERLEGPICKNFGGAGIIVEKTGAHRDGLGYRGDQLGRYLVGYAWACATENYLMNIIEHLKSNYDECSALWDQYKDRLKAFRSEVKNDLVSLDAAARKSTDAANRLQAAYGGVIAQLRSDDMAQAIANAERLAAAMAALSSLQSHKLTFSVAGQQETP